MSGYRGRLWRAGAALVVATAVLVLGLRWFSAASQTAVRNASETVDWPAVTLTRVVTGLVSPVHVTHAGDGSGRLFVVEKAGRIQIVQDGTLSGTPFLSIEDRVGSDGSEQGLLSVAFPPAYEQKAHFYVNYTDLNGDTVVARYHLGADPDRADPASEEVVLTQTQPYVTHNGGQLAFGPDGYLYVGMGDGGSAGDPDDNAQDPTSLLGKMLRIDVEPAAPAPPFTATDYVYLPVVLGGREAPRYQVPQSNPYTDTAGYRGEIWALGLRNPWRFSFDRSTGDLYIGDVGQGAYEEIDFQPSPSSGGENYGWAVMEGSHCYPGPPCDQTGLVLPVAEYGHSGGNCSVTGGLVYRGPGNPTLTGIYVYGDYCSGRIWGLVQDGGAWQAGLLKETGLTITSFGEDETGNLYVADFREGAIYQITEGQ
jgi:glucose/arabinose dehydrogenase